MERLGLIFWTNDIHISKHAKIDFIDNQNITQNWSVRVRQRLATDYFKRSRPSFSKVTQPFYYFKR